MMRWTMAGAAALAAGTAAYLAKRPIQLSRIAASTRRQRALATYLREHLTGSDTAIQVVQRLAALPASGEREALFRHLLQEFEGERAVLRTLLMQLGASERSVKRVAGVASGTLLSLAAGGEPGDLGLLRTLEGLAIGVQGKRCLWRAMQGLPSSSTLSPATFVELEEQAVRQWEEIEQQRRAVVPRTFSLTVDPPPAAVVTPFRTAAKAMR